MLSDMKNPLLRRLSLFLAFWLIVFCCSVRVQAAQQTESNVAVNFGVLYVEDNAGKMGLKCIQMALSDFYNSHGHYKTRLALHTRAYPKNDAVAAASAALNLLKYSEAKAIIIGPTTSSVEIEFVTQLGDKTQVPIISYSATIPSLSSRPSPFFMQAAQKDSLQVQAITSLMQAFQWQEVIVIHEDTEYGSGFLAYLNNALQEIGARIPSHVPLSSSPTDEHLLGLLQKLKAKQTRVFLVHITSLELSSRLFLQVNQLKMMDEGYAWTVTTTIGNELSTLNHSMIEAMQGVIGMSTYVPETSKLKQFKSHWDQESKGFVKVDVMGLWAYDAASALARAIEKVAAPNSAFRRTSMTGNVTELDTLSVSLTGPDLVQALLDTTFRGLAGNFSLAHDGHQLRSSTFKIFNVLDGGTIRGVGFWTPEHGLTRKLHSTTSGSTRIVPSKKDLRLVIWPGETASPPKGWQIPADGSKLRVGVPDMKHVYEQLVNVTEVRSNGSAMATGFCIDIFETVMEKLGYSGHYVYYPFTESNGTYDEMVYQVFLQKYDIVVGDVTITANRTNYVEFTLPYTESGVTMVVPVRSDRQSAWVFLKPLTPGLWQTILFAFLYIAFIIWVFEHRINEEFRGPKLHQIGTSIFHSFSMMVFAQRENVFSNLTRFVVIVWVFFVLILTQSYTASLTSMLTVQQLQPIITSVDELLNTGANVGILEGTFVKKLLIQKGFHESKIVTYSTAAELDNLLSRGSSDGGIAAVFDEIPYMRLFLANKSSKYTMVQPLYKTDGFGFALPKGSPLVPEISREILKIIEGDKMLSLESKWHMQLYNSSDQGNQVTSGSLSLDSFWGLFLIVAVTSGISLIIYFSRFLCEHKDIWMYPDTSVWSRIQKLAKAFQQRDMSSHTFRKTEEPSVRNLGTDQTSIVGDHAAYETQTDSPSVRFSDYSDQTEESSDIPVGTTSPSERVSHPVVQE